MGNVADILPKPVRVVLDKERSLIYDFQALALIEQHYGTLGEAMEALSKGSIAAIQVFLWAGLKREDESLTLEEVGRWAPGAALNVSDKITEALSGALPGETKNASEAPQ